MFLAWMTALRINHHKSLLAGMAVVSFGSVLFYGDKIFPATLLTWGAVFALRQVVPRDPA